MILLDQMETLFEKSRKKKSKQFERKVSEYVFARSAHFD
jgi:hypothetical protein